MIKGIGCDIVEISRIERLLVQSKFKEKVYTSYEQEIISDKNAHTAAGIWAAKEAVSKALGTGFFGFTTRDVEVCHNENGQPFVVLYNGAKKTATERNIDRIHISISHEKEQTIAFAVAE